MQAQKRIEELARSKRPRLGRAMDLVNVQKCSAIRRLVIDFRGSSRDYFKHGMSMAEGQSKGSERNRINADQFAAKLRPLILELQANGAGYRLSRRSLHGAGSGPRGVATGRAPQADARKVMSIARRRDTDGELMREAAAYPLPSTVAKIKSLDQMDQKRCRALRRLVLSGMAVLLVLGWVFG